MQKASSLRGKWWSAILLLTATLVVVADQLSKLWIRSNLLVGQSLFEVGFFRFTHIHNTGAAFGLFRGHSLILTVVALFGVALLLLYAFLLYRRYPLLNNRLSRVALGLVLGGTIGNLIDRLHLGYVTDFLDFTAWPAFNIADSAVTVGVIIIAYSLLSLARAGKG
ncbi:MAG: signal peptidase II [Dehalococcoidales bacterium]|nr:signal peptidase II [Dehalococcoidales bacterium]